MLDAVRKAGSERKPEKLTGIPHASVHYYKKFKWRLPYNRFNLLAGFLGFKKSDFVFELIDPKEFRVKGGIEVQEKYLKENRFFEIHKRMRRGSSNYMKKWHQKMKKENPEAYYKLQYERFKKVADYKKRTMRGEFVRTDLELEVANLLFELGLDYCYKPFLSVCSKSYFPDFKIGNLIIECTAWRGEQKAYSLLSKIRKLEESGYAIKVVIPDNLRRFYKPIENYILSTSELRNLF